MPSARTSDRFLAALTAALLHTGCDSSITPVPAVPSANPSSGGASGARSPHNTTAPASIELGHPPTGDELRRGRQVFGAACGRCHSPEGGAPSVVGLRLTPGRLMALLHAGDDEGRRLMPAINPGDMTNADLPVLVAWLRSENAVQ